MTKLADKVEGRTISCVVYIELRPKDTQGKIGEVNGVWEIGKGLIEQALIVLQMAAEKEGFNSTIDVRPLVY